MFGVFLKATNSSFQKGMTFCRSIYVKIVMKLLAFIFEQSSYASNAPFIIHGYIVPRVIETYICVHYQYGLWCVL